MRRRGESLQSGSGEWSHSRQCGGGHTVILLYADDYTHTQVYHSSAPSGPLRKTFPIVIHAALPLLHPSGL